MREGIEEYRADQEPQHRDALAPDQIRESRQSKLTQETAQQVATKANGPMIMGYLVKSCTAG